jgi:ABC-type transport system substrate-binding protein
VTSYDVTFFFERYRGVGLSLMKQRIAAVETSDALRVRFKLNEPWPPTCTARVWAR